jgi:hypothetical protein
VDRDRPPDDRPAVAVPTRGLTLRPGPDREVITHRHRTYRLRDADVRLLATVGVFRVVRADDLQATGSSRDAWTGALRHLRDEGLLDAKTVTVNREALAVVVLTRAGKALLESHQDADLGGARQAFHAGLVKPRELAHDAQLFRLFQAEGARIEADGGRVTHVMLDYELKRDYQTFLNRPDRLDDADDDLHTFAARSGLPIVDGHLELPDLRIEYESPDGDVWHRDVELVTEHYSRAQLAGKARAGFALYRAVGAGLPRGGSARAGGTPVDPHHLEWMG